MGKQQATQKEQSKAQAAQRQRQGEIVRSILDQWAEVMVANGERTSEQGPFLAIDAWAEWTESTRTWEELRETLLSLAASSEETQVLESLFPPSGPTRACVEICKLADQLVYNRQLSEAAARWRAIQKGLTP